MINIHGVSASLGAFEQGLWYDSDRKQYNPHGWGIKLAIIVGSFARPVRKFWTKQNCWQEEAWFTLRLPFIILPFISIAIGRFGFYLGGKVFTADADEPWAKPEEYGKKMLTLSATLRRTRNV